VNMHSMAPPPGGDPFGWLMVLVGGAILIYSSFLAIKATIRPDETDPEHPKNVILRSDR